MIELDLKNAGIENEEFDVIKEQTCSAYKTLMDRTGAGSEMLGWLNLPNDYDQEEFARINAAAEKIKAQSEILVCIGIGGSYLGARAAIEFEFGQFANQTAKNRGAAEVYFAGNNISSTYIQGIIDIIGDRSFSINVISKSGTTTEPAVAFRIFKKLLEEKYGKEKARERIYCTTDANRGALHDMAKKEGYEMFVVPDATGGRFSVLTAVGLLPMAASGMSIYEVMRGAKDSCDKFDDENFDSNYTMQYAAARHIMSNKGKNIEILANYEPSLVMFGEWFKQLMAESEGKEHKGIFPVSANFSTDLHSIGQYIQDGKRNLFETVIWAKESNAKMVVPDDPENSDQLNFVSYKTLHYINEQAMKGTLLAHVDGGTPNIVINIDKLSAYEFGQLVYFFWKSLAISAYMLGVNPFDQPGVEAYKRNMFALLDKPGYEDIKKCIEFRLMEGNKFINIQY